VGGGSDVYAFNARTGTKLWNYTTGGYVFSSPAIANGVVYVGSDDGNVYALNARTGAKLWNSTSGGTSSPAVVNGAVYVGGGSDVYALNATTGAKLWNYATGGYVSSSPAVSNGVVYVGSNDHNVYALNATTGAKLWNYTTGSYVTLSSPAVANGVVYVGSWDHNVYALYANNGTKLWNFTTGSIVFSSPAVLNGVVYAASFDDGQLYAIGTEPIPAAVLLSLNSRIVSTTTTTYTFSGQLITTSWTPVANAPITLQSSADKVHWSAVGSPVTTNAQGAYKFKGILNPGSYYFRTFYAGTSTTSSAASRIVKVVISSNGSRVVSDA
jgi:outer membrane protein assembly factor BamB